MSAMSPCPIARLAMLAEIASSKEIIPTRLTFVDIAGLVRGASKGEGLGNQFLANIRECDAIAHVVRCFEDGDITHVEGRIDPLSDIETIETELMLADLESLERRIVAIEKKAKGADKEAKETLALVSRCLAELREGRPARARRASARRARAVPVARPAVVEARALCLQCRGGLRRQGQCFFRKGARKARGKEGAVAVVVSAKIESEIAVLPQAEQKDYLDAVGLDEPGLNRVIRAGYALLHLVTFFTVGPKEARAWTVEKGSRGAAGGGRHPHRFREGLHSRRNDRL